MYNSLNFYETVEHLDCLYYYFTIYDKYISDNIFMLNIIHISGLFSANIFIVNMISESKGMLESVQLLSRSIVPIYDATNQTKLECLFHGNLNITMLFKLFPLMAIVYYIITILHYCIPLYII